MASLISSSVRLAGDIPQVPSTEPVAQENIKARKRLHQLVKEYLSAQIALEHDLIKSRTNLSQEKINNFKQKERAIAAFLDNHHTHISLKRQEIVRNSMKNMRELIKKVYGVQLDRLGKASEEKKRAQVSK